MADPSGGRVKPADRRWVLLGMAMGTGVGALPAAVPDPVGSVLMWVCSGTFIGFVGPLLKLLVLLTPAGQKVWWWLSGCGAVIGGLVGAVLGLQGQQPPEWAIMATCTCGFFAGFAVVEVYLRRLDARRGYRGAGKPDRTRP